jgi:Transposase IS66 family
MSASSPVLGELSGSHTGQAPRAREADSWELTPSLLALLQHFVPVFTTVFCRAHVRRDFVKIGKGWPDHKEWALARLGRIRALYRHDRRRRDSKVGSVEFTAADVELRQTVAAMQTQADAESADPKLLTPCGKVLTRLEEHRMA